MVDHRGLPLAITLSPRQASDKAVLTDLRAGPIPRPAVSWLAAAATPEPS